MSWEQISIAKYLQIVETVEKYQKQDPLDEIGYLVDMLSIVNGQPAQDFLSLPVTDLKALSEQIAFISTPPKPRFSGDIDVAGKRYKVAINMRDLTTSQYIDYTETLRHDPNNIAMMCAIFCVPEGFKYNDGYDVIELSNHFYEEFLMVDAMGISFFFTQLLKTYTNATLSFLKQALKKEQRKMRKDKEKIVEIRKTIEVLNNVGGLI